MDQLHSKEPWTLSPLGKTRTQVIEAAGVSWPIAMLHQPGDGARECMRPEKFATLSGFDHQANGRRIVACVNVCEGISTEVLELNATAGGIATLERQRDEAAAISLELLAALEGLVDLTKPILNALLLSAGDRDSILLADKINSGHPARHKLIAKAKGGQHSTPANLKRAELLAVLKLYEAAHSDLFAQCCSNPITNAWGKPVDMTSFNLAHEAASSAIKKVEGGAV